MRTIVNLVLLFAISGLILAQTPDTSLIAYYPFNGNAIDVTGNGHNGTVNGGILTTDRFNQSDKAYTFPNLHNNIVLESTTGLNLENGFTINAWVKYKNINCGIVGKHNCWYVNGFNLGIDNGQFWLVLANSVWSIVKTNETYVEDKWYMVTGVYDQVTSTGKVFINGVLKASGSVLYNNYSTAPITISEASNGCPDGNMPGAIDEVKIYNRPLSDTEILDEYNRTYTDLVLFLPFNGNANDESGNNNNGTVNGAQLTQDRFGINNRAYQFNGASDFISIADNPNLFSDELTISWWYKLTETPGAAWVVTGWVDGGHRYQQFFSGGQIAYLNGYNLSQPGVYFNPLYGLNDLDVWKNVVVTYKKLSETTSTTSIYVDGELKQTDDHTLAMDYASGADFFIGKNHNGNFFKGSLDDFRIYNRILNNDEILALYNDSTTYFSDSLIAYFPFNGNANDESFLHNNGTVFNTLLTTDRYANSDAAYYFNGSDSRIYVPENSLYDFGFGDFTITSWVNASEIKTARIVSAGYDANDNIWGFGFGTHPVWGNGNRINYFVYSNDDYRDFSSNEIISYSPGEWSFIAVSKINNQIRFFKDGFLVGSIQILYPSNSNSYMSIGCRQWLSNNLTEYFNGKIDEVKIFNKSFSDQQIWDMYKVTTTAPNLIFPSNDSTLINPYPTITLDWDSTVTANQYHLIIASDSLFNTVIKDTITNTSSVDLQYEFFIYYDNQYWKVRTINDGGIGPWSEINHFNFLYTDVENEQQLPTEFALLQNYPNPFNPSTTITYHLPKTASVELKVYDVLGNEIATLVNEQKPAGVYNVQFTMNSLSSGIYFYKLTAGDYISTKKMILMR